MKQLHLISVILCCLWLRVYPQTAINLRIKSGENQSNLSGATVFWQEAKQSFVADRDGIISIQNIPAGRQTFLISHIGFEKMVVSYTFPLLSEEIGTIELKKAEAGQEEEVRVSATRTSRTIANTPTRIEIISGEELDEKGNMKPGDIRMLLNESTGIQTQQTSATSYNSSIRIQGLEGRYTQILRDGYPLYSGFSAGLSIMQIAPLDLRQVEVIKGAASTLYGGGAIAGLVNLVSKIPVPKRELSFMANATSARGLDLSGFYSQKFNKAGITVFGSRNTGSPYDPAGIGLTAIPKFKRYTLTPRLFLYGKKTTADVGFSFVTEDRIGGSMDFLKRGVPGYFEKNNTDRFSAQVGLNHSIGAKSNLSLKNSYTRFNRNISIPSYQFQGLQQSTFSEVTYSIFGEKAQWIAGANLLTDGFEEAEPPNNLPRNYYHSTFGIFIQNTWNLSQKVVLETGLRGDYIRPYVFELLPRLSALIHISSYLTTRIGGGFGYKAPTIFTEEAERTQFKHLLPIQPNQTTNERSAGGNWDINYQARFGGATLSINQLFFYTKLNKPLELVHNGTNLVFENSKGYIDTKGLETNIKLTYNDFKLFIGYTYTDVNKHAGSLKSWFPLTARHRLNNILMFEKEEKLKLGLEAYYVSPQKTTDGSLGKSYWITGFMAEKLWEKFSLFLNFENITDTRQTKFDIIYTGTISNPTFRDIYAPVDGFIINGGVKLKL